jgi:hypothetical protein
MRFILISVISLLFYLTPANADVNYETWYCPSWPCPTSSNTLLSSGTLSDSTMNYNWGGGEVLDSGRSDYVVVHLDGYITVPIPSNGSAGDSVTVTFYNQDDDGSILKIDGTTVINDWSGLHAPTTRSGTITLQAGETYTYERWMSEWGGGAVLRQLWYVPNATAGAVYVNASTDISTTVTSYTSSISNSQQTSVNNSRGVTHSGNGIYIEQSGNNNQISVVQDGEDNLIAGRNTTSNSVDKADIDGNNNTATMTQRGNNNVILFGITGDYNTTTVDQGGSSGADNNRAEFLVGGDYNTIDITQEHNNGIGNNGHYVAIGVAGNNNNVLTSQSDDGDKIGFISITGDDNDIDLIQKGTGSHYSEIAVGSDQTVAITQDGSGNHNASVSMSGYDAALNLLQDSATDQTYSINQTCLNANGCGTTSLTQQ